MQFACILVSRSRVVTVHFRYGTFLLQLRPTFSVLNYVDANHVESTTNRTRYDEQMI